MVDKGATGNVATNSYHMFRTDIALMKSMGLKHYRSLGHFLKAFVYPTVISTSVQEHLACEQRYQKTLRDVADSLLDPSLHVCMNVAK